ncbi:MULTISPECIES: chemotaxis protein CheW [unclassified Janthinobacterium]|uniref:chemotaxis protein CheW n=1 Tax=unclassified Janthinobacterium TaxID=2610881 RepID=UPI0018CB65BD|nr:chemotaxis protein CheW [Janthinobacterium sp. CG_23.4]MDH6159528.1 twitching motility protein PilI [Janthinobacterium sp. CG_23.4]
MQTMPGHGASITALPAAAIVMSSCETGARQGRLRQYQLQLIERIQAARSGALAARKELGVMLGGRPCLLDLTQLGEIVIASGVQIQGVPLAQDWYLGLAAMRGRLTGVVDLARYMGEPACAPGNHCRIITFSPRLGLNCALLVERVLGLRQLRTMQSVPLPATLPRAAPSWAAQALRDSEGQHWLRLDLVQLAQAERFLDAGFAGLAAHKDVC